ncbi:hypothetical protein WG66_015992 [Moniliophthora roreri]|nr:hypothetical protein WG66_015992 [Moniliophthora roreri]
MAKAARWLFSGNPQNQPSRDSAKPVAIPIVSSADAKKFGLENFGNTCYANSVIQALYFCTPFRDLLIQSPDSSLPLAVVETTSTVASPTPPPPSATVRRKPERKLSSSGTPGDVLPLPPVANNGGTPIPTSPPSLFSALRSLFLHISTNPSDKGTVAPRAFIDKLKEVNELFRSTMHQDAHEFFNYLLNKVVEEIEEDRKHIHGDPPSLDDLSTSIATLASKAAPTVVTTASTNSGNAPKVLTLVHKLFEGTLTSETRCLTCETRNRLSTTIQRERNVMSEEQVLLRLLLRPPRGRKKASRFQSEMMKIKKLPNILALHLKRFKYQEDLRKYIKLAYRVAFPFQLRLFNTVDDSEDADRLYNLFAIVVHIGNGPHHGHYISIIKTMGTWLVFDDDTVSTIAESEIPKYYGESNAGSAYVLYYEAADLDPSSLGLRTPVTMSTASVVPATESVVASGSPQAVHPILPPGLEEGDSSDLSDPPFPITPSSSSPLLAPESSDKPSRPPLQLDLAAPITDGSTSVPSSAASNAAVPPNGRSKKLFTSMRRRSETADGPESSQPLVVEDKVPTPSIDASLETSSATSHGQVNGSGSRSPSPHPASVPPRETKEKEKEKEGKEKEKKEKKEKEPHRKPSGWFKRRSVRVTDRPSTSHESSASHKHEDTSTNTMSSTSSNVSSPAWYKSATSNGKRMRKQSDHSMFDAAGFALTSARKSNVDGLTVTTSRDRRSQHDYSDTPPSATSSTHSTNYSAPAPANAGHTHTLEHPPPRKSSLASVPPSIDTSVAASLPTLPQSPRIPSKQPKSPDHKLSLSHLTGRKGHRKGSTEIARPATATGTISDSLSKPKHLPPVPPLPAPLGPASPLANGHVRSLMEDRITDPIPRPVSASGQTSPPPGLHTFNGKHNSTGSTVSPTNTVLNSGTGGAATIRRATRKLSISSPILGGFGFGKKDKEKKEKEKPPSSFAFLPS